MSGKKIIAALLLILAVFFAGYGIFVRMAGSGTGFFLIWFALAGIALLFSIGIGTGWIQRLPAFLRITVRILLIAAAAIVAVTWGLVLSDFHDRGEQNLDYIVVLGAQVREDGPSPVLKYRLDTAFEYLKNNPETRCIVSGGKGSNEPSAEGDVMKEYLIRKGIDSGRIIAETESLNTVQNIENCAKILNIKKDSVGIVTNNFHVFRGLHIARKKGYRHVCGIAASSNSLYLLNNMLRETGGIVKDLIGGSI